MKLENTLDAKSGDVVELMESKRARNNKIQNLIKISASKAK